MLSNKWHYSSESGAFPSEVTMVTKFYSILTVVIDYFIKIFKGYDTWSIVITLI